MKNVVKLDNYFAPEELEAALEKFVYRYNNERYHESLNNLTPADVYFGRGELIVLLNIKIVSKFDSISKERSLNSEVSLLNNSISVLEFFR